MNKLPIVGGWKSGNDKHVYLGCIPYCVGYAQVHTYLLLSFRFNFHYSEQSSPFDIDTDIGWIQVESKGP